MMDKNERFSIYLRVGLWIGLADGELAHAEFVMAHRRLSGLFPQIENIEVQIREQIQKFQKDYDSSVEKLIEDIYNTEDLEKRQLWEYSQTIAIDDGKLVEGEDLALERLARVLKIKL